MLDLEPREAVNYPEGYKEKPWCPNTKLIQICASLVGTELKPGTFCAEKVSDPIYSNVCFDPHLKSAWLHPDVSCKNVQIILFEQMGLVEKEIKEPVARGIEEQLENSINLEDKVAIVTKFAKEMEEYQKRKETIKRWREVLFETSYSKTGDDPNPHFRQFNSPEEIPFEEIVGKVKSFIGALEKITGYDAYGQLRIDLHGGARNCPQSPIMHQYEGL